MHVNVVLSSLLVGVAADGNDGGGGGGTDAGFYVVVVCQQALRKALFKPGAFFKGLILPLCEVPLTDTTDTHQYLYFTLTINTCNM